jgi:hypothetical protein
MLYGSEGDLAWEAGLSVHGQPRGVSLQHLPLQVTIMSLRGSCSACVGYFKIYLNRLSPATVQSYTGKNTAVGITCLGEVYPLHMNITRSL